MDERDFIVYTFSFIAVLIMLVTTAMLWGEPDSEYIMLFAGVLAITVQLVGIAISGW